MMTRSEWGLILALTLVTVLSLAFVPPAGQQGLAPATPAPTATATPTLALPTSTITPMPSSTIMPSATASPASEPSPTATRTATPTSTPSPTPTAFPFDTRPDLARYIYIDQTTQHLFIFERGRLLRDIPCSTGIPDPDKYTPGWSGEVGHYVGTFFAFDVYADDAWYLFMSQGAILIHSLPYTWKNGYKVYQDREALGVRPASHGCVRIAPEEAAWFSAWKPEGVPIIVSEPPFSQQP